MTITYSGSPVALSPPYAGSFSFVITTPPWTWPHPSWTLDDVFPWSYGTQVEMPGWSGGFESYFRFTFGDFEFKDSVTTLRTDKKTIVRLVPKRLAKIDLTKYLRVPVKPLHNPPKWSKIDTPPTLKEPKVYLFRPPKRYSSESAQHYDARLSRKREAYDKHVEKLRSDYRKSYDKRRVRWDAKRKAFFAKLDSYERTFTKRSLKYEKRLALLEKRKAIVEKWKHTPASWSSRPRYTEDHPYRYLKVLGTGSGVFGVLNGGYWGADTGHLWYTFVPQRNPASINLPWLSQLTSENFMAILESSCHDAVADLEAKLVSKLHEKIRGADFHVGNILAERAQTYSMLADLILRFSQLATGKKRLLKSVTHFIKNPKLIANDILAFEFGVLPLLSDAASLGKLIAQWETSDGDLVFRVNGHIPVNFPIGGNVNYTFSGICEISYVVKVDVDFGAARYLSQLGLINPLEIAWEVMPWSFVVDWFLPVQTWIESMSSQTGLRFKTGTRKIRLLGSCSTGSSSGSVCPFGLTPRDVLYQTPISVIQDGELSVKLKHRTVLTSVPEMSDIVIHNRAFSLTHIIESVALIVQRMKWFK